MLLKQTIFKIACCAGLVTSISLGYAQSSGDVNLATQTSNTIGLTVSGYQYKEPSVNVVINSPLVGVDYSGIYAWGNDWFVKGDAHYAYGSAKYMGSGTQNNIPYSYSELRGLVGHDFSFTELGGFTLAPYIGIGYRYLFDNQAGSTTTGARSYNRSSTYVYLPIGVMHRMRINGAHKLETTFEYDYLIQGTQVSNLSQASSSLPDITNQQNRGYGLRLSSMYQLEQWSFGPYANYWNIQNSNYVAQSTTIGGVRYTANWYEPANTTIEVGLKLAYSF